MMSEERIQIVIVASDNATENIGKAGEALRRFEHTPWYIRLWRWLRRKKSYKHHPGLGLALMGMHPMISRIVSAALDFERTQKNISAEQAELCKMYADPVSNPLQLDDQ